MLMIYLCKVKMILKLMTITTIQNQEKVKLVAKEFIDYAIVWWDQFILSWIQDRERHTKTWEEMKAIIMGKRFFQVTYMSQCGGGYNNYYSQVPCCLNHYIANMGELC